MRVVTKEWMDAHRTANGAWTAAQFSALGIPMYPPKGWRDRLVGKVISDEVAEAFERGKTEFRSNKLAREAVQGRLEF